MEAWTIVFVFILHQILGFELFVESTSLTEPGLLNCISIFVIIANCEILPSRFKTCYMPAAIFIELIVCIYINEVIHPIVWPFIEYKSRNLTVFVFSESILQTFGVENLKSFCLNFCSIIIIYRGCLYVDVNFKLKFRLNFKMKYLNSKDYYDYIHNIFIKNLNKIYKFRIHQCPRNFLGWRHTFEFYDLF